MKRIIFVLLAIFMCFGLCAQGKTGLGLTINVHPLGYMNHTDITQYNKTDADSKLGKVLDEISGQSGTLWIESDAKQTDIYNAYAFGVDIRYSFFILVLISVYRLKFIVKVKVLLQELILPRTRKIND